MTADAVLPNPAVETGSGWSVPALLALILRKVRRLLLSDEEKSILHLIEFGSSRFGASLLEAKSLDDLDERIESIIEDPDLQALNSLMLAAMPEELLNRAPPQTDAAPEALELWGASADASLREAFRLIAWSMVAVGQLFSAHGEAIKLRIAQEMRASKPLGFLTDRSIPPEVGLSMLGAMRANACVLAISQAFLAGTKPEPWLGRAIADRLAAGQRLYLCLLASLPGTEVPYEVIPAEDRFDLPWLMGRTIAAEERLNELAQEARRAGGGVHPPHAEPGDDQD